MFDVLIKEHAQKSLFKINKKYRNRIIKVLTDLRNNPVPYKIYDIKKLEGCENHFRIRVGKIRIVYELFAKESKIKVHDIDFRGRIY